MQSYRELLLSVQQGQISVEQALEGLKQISAEDLGFAKIDHHRTLRKGFPEVVYCAGKTVEQSAQILERLASANRSNIIGTRAPAELYDRIKPVIEGTAYYPLSRMLTIERTPPESKGQIAVVCAGTSDLPVAEEALITCKMMGSRAELICDVGVAGIHRLFNQLDHLYQANVIIVVAGMEGALVSVIAGLVDKPVIAVPTSVGYGANLNGITTLLSMLNSCSSGVTVVNVDNGFGAGYAAALINSLAER